MKFYGLHDLNSIKFINGFIKSLFIYEMDKFIGFWDSRVFSYLFYPIFKTPRLISNQLFIEKRNDNILKLPKSLTINVPVGPRS